jgi:hypothetical protein
MKWGGPVSRAAGPWQWQPGIALREEGRPKRDGSYRQLSGRTTGERWANSVVNFPVGVLVLRGFVPLVMDSLMMSGFPRPFTIPVANSHISSATIG